jgi:hypothetical protein
MSASRLPTSLTSANSIFVQESSQTDLVYLSIKRTAYTVWTKCFAGMQLYALNQHCLN